jgi:phage gp37-like protein
VIGALEDAIICRLKEAFQNRVREVDHKPAKFDADELLRILSQAPAIYVAFLGFQRTERPPSSVRATYGAYMVAANASGERARRRGDEATIGAYEMAVLTAATLERWVPEGAAGPMEVQSCENLYATAFEKAGRTVYGLVCDVPVQIQDGWGVPVLDNAAPGAGTDADAPPSFLDNFITFHADQDIPPFGNVATPPPAPEAGANRADAVLRVTLPTA